MQDCFPINFDTAKFTPIDTVPNPGLSEKAVQIVDPEFSSVCPKTGLPDYGTVILCYVPHASCVELKAWKLYLRDWYGVGAFHERCTDEIIQAFVLAVKPRWVGLTINWGARGGLHTVTGMAWTEEGGYEPMEFCEPAFVEAITWDNRR